jgi:hypothetical protein
MAWIEQQQRADGGLTARMIWRPGGGRDATRVWETFSVGSYAITSRALTVSSGWSTPRPAMAGRLGNPGGLACRRWFTAQLVRFPNPDVCPLGTQVY